MYIVIPQFSDDAEVTMNGFPANRLFVSLEKGQVFASVVDAVDNGPAIWIGNESIECLWLFRISEGQLHQVANWSRSKNGDYEWGANGFSFWETYKSLKAQQLVKN